MKYLLDTHAFLWWLFDDPKLAGRVRGLIGDADNTVFVSSASVWEIATKFRLGKLPHAAEVAADVPAWIGRAQFTPLPISPAHAQLAGSWKLRHGDPFDRMLAAQARLSNMPLITSDKAFGLFDIDTVWRG